MTKLDDILNDDSKFTPITDDPIKNLKKQLNYIAKTNNAVSNYMKFPVLVGDYKPGYIYGNCKIQKFLKYLHQLMKWLNFLIQLLNLTHLLDPL